AHMPRINSFWIPLVLATLLGAGPARAQVNIAFNPYSLTLEGYTNVTAGSADDGRGASSNTVREDLAIRALARFKIGGGPDLGVRLVVESSPEDRVDLAEASILLSGSHGRLELGQRQGLPDVLTGYAPNNFAFTGAE